ncbi:MAG: hypothetical protein JWN04_848 [Myxococcaceae bacterium]|nr:hypothetical protein [Myxococcaceae bacterium]
MSAPPQSSLRSLRQTRIGFEMPRLPVEPVRSRAAAAMQVQPD